MIEGLKLDFTSEQLQEHIRARCAYHRNKAEWYAGEIARLKEGGLDRTGASHDPIDGLERHRKDHADKYALFSVLAEHVIPKETYRLTQSDLCSMEFISRYY
jgi:hypothetical protein